MPARSFGPLTRQFASPADPDSELDGDPLEICRMVCCSGGFTIVTHADRAFGKYRLPDSELLEVLMFDSCALAVEVCHSTEYAQLMHHAAPALVGSPAALERADTVLIEALAERHR